MSVWVLISLVLLAALIASTVNTVGLILVCVAAMLIVPVVYYFYRNSQ